LCFSSLVTFTHLFPAATLTKSPGDGRLLTPQIPDNQTGKDIHHRSDEAENPGELQNLNTLNTLMVLVDGVADLEKLRRQALAEIQVQQDQQITCENRLLAALETLGRGEDPLTQGIEQTTENLVRISYQHFPEGTEQVLNALSHVDNAIEAVVEFIDDSTANTASAVWQTLDESTQARILGAGKILSVLVPVAKVKALTELAKAPSPALKKDGWHPDSVEARHEDWQGHYGGREDYEYQGISGYVPAPEKLMAYPDAAREKRKTPVQRGGQVRARWKDSKGNIYEWDYQHGSVEKYDKRGKHLGEYDPRTGEPLKGVDDTRSVEP
jgi:hypothetical protein